MLDDAEYVHRCCGELVGIGLDYPCFNDASAKIATLAAESSEESALLLSSKLLLEEVV